MVLYRLMLGSGVMQRVLSGVSKSTRAKPLEGFWMLGRMVIGRFWLGTGWTGGDY